MKTLVIGCSNARDIARKTAKRLRVPYSDLFVDRFPDGELRVAVKAKNVAGSRVVLFQSMSSGASKNGQSGNVNDDLVELYLAGMTAYRLGAARVELAVPYFAYMRQDKAFHYGEAVSSEIVGRLFSHFDAIYTLDPHMHRHHRMNEIFGKDIRAVKLTANGLIGQYVQTRYPRAVVMGPDGESSQWAEGIAAVSGRPVVVLNKKRYSSNKVKIDVRAKSNKKGGFGVDWNGADVVIVDDIIATGHTMLEPIKQLKRLGARRITAVCVHGVFANGAASKILKAGASAVVATNSIPTPYSTIDASALFAEALR